MSDDRAIQERLMTAQCLKNAHGHIATAYAQLDDPYGPGHARRVARETLDAVDWLRRALEHFDALLGEPEA